MSSDDLREYRAKRDPLRTPEPAGADGGGEPGLFVVQRHAASTLHFDFRLDIGGVLVSWSVPKGPSLDPGDKRLAIRTEDHPREYASFEGVIPQAEYGGGTVIVWDTGSFESLTEEPASEALRKGHLRVELHGQRLTGAFSLVRTEMGGDKQNWLLVKKNDAGADRRRKPAATQLTSVLSGRTNDELKGRS